MHIGFIMVILLTAAPCMFVMFFVELNDERPVCLFHRWRIVETRKLDGSFEYRVERNGSLGMPFLYSEDRGRIGDSVLTEYFSRGLTLEKAKELVSERISAYKSTTTSGETYMYVVDVHRDNERKR